MSRSISESGAGSSLQRGQPLLRKPAQTEVERNPSGMCISEALSN